MFIKKKSPSKSSTSTTYKTQQPVDGVDLNEQTNKPKTNTLMRALEPRIMLDAPCVIDQCVDYVKDTSDVVALYDFYPEQMIWIPWLSGGGRNAELRGGLLLERQQEWTTSDIARLNKLVAVYAQSVDAMPSTFPPPEKPSKLSALRLGLSAAVVIFSLVMASLSWALMDAEAVSPGAGEALFSIESTDPGSSPESYI